MRVYSRTKKKWPDIYQLCGVILTPTVRYIVEYMKAGRIERVFHNDRWGCRRIDSTGFCTGHPIKRRNFINLYCNGEEPERMD